MVLPPNQSSNARAYFEYIKSQPDPFAFLAAIPDRAEPFFEEEWIDFKGMPAKDEDTRAIWSKALSGYANITDGLIVWGIDARQDPERKIDAPCGLRPIQNTEIFESQLRDWIRDATNPPVMDVEFKSYFGPEGPGFVVCFIPGSRHKPHRAEYAKKHYYYRAGDDFLIAEPGLLRTLFYPQSYPYLWVEVNLRFELQPQHVADEYKNYRTQASFDKLLNSYSTMYYRVLVYNTGIATANDLYVVVNANKLLNFHQGTDWTIREHPHAQTAFRSYGPLHPGAVSTLFSASHQESFGNKQKQANSLEFVPRFDTLSLRLLIYAESMQQQEINVEFNSEDTIFENDSVTKEGIPSL